MLQNHLLGSLDIRVTPQIWTEIGLVDIVPVGVVVGQTLPYEILTAIRDLRLGRELDLSGVENSLILQDVLLT